MDGPVKISVTIITLNEEKKLEPCLQSVHDVADEILVVDSFSTDATEAICRKYGVRFIQHPFAGYVGQKNYAMMQATYNHVLALDADERLTDELRASILAIKQNWGGFYGYSFNRINNYCGKWMRFSMGYPDRKVRLWDRRKGSWGGTDPHDTVQLARKNTRKLDGDLLHYAYFTIDEHLRQVLHFGEVAARAKYAKGERANFVVHLLLNPMFKFVKKYLFQLGFLDGYYGFVFCAASASLNFYKYLRLYEYGRKGLNHKS
jgi:glycosyltransferase involved in cell wall biosynthesis